jgi:lycopene cyclase domain-containing protein
MQHFLYLSLILFTLSYPLYKSFEDKVHFAGKWKFLFPGILCSAIFFIIWDILFTRGGVWSFNPAYTLGIYILDLPLEEWLFFIVVPFSCMFIYEVMNYFVKRDIWGKISRHISNVLILTLSLLAALYHDRTYTVTVFSILAFFIFLLQHIFRVSYLGRFYLAWCVCIVPFLLVNGILTATPVVIYSNPETIGFRIYTIPVEDVFYGMLNILQVLAVYEWLKRKHQLTPAT